MMIQTPHLEFAGRPSLRRRTVMLVLHHPAMPAATPEQIHAIHLRRGWRGAGYHYLVRKDGSVHSLRPQDEVGAHAGVGALRSHPGYTNNTESVGLCFEGYFHPRDGLHDTAMGAAQMAAGDELILYLLAKYPDIHAILAHREMPGAHTACPGDFFPLSHFKALLAQPCAWPRSLKRGCRGEDVRRLQERLNALGFPCGAADGIFGPQTLCAVLAAQAAHSLVADGIAGPNTRAALGL